jgi:two-component system LytT family response regulator
MLRYLCNEYAEHIDVIDEAESGATAIALINQLTPDFIFLDIEMGDMTGFDVLHKIKYKPNIIFTTAYEQFAIKAFEDFAVDYLLKPIKDERFKTAIEKLAHFGKTDQPINAQQIQQLINSLRPKPAPSALTVKIGDKILLVNFTDILYMEAQDKYVHVHTTENQKYLTDLTLTALEEKLPDFFMRVQKSFIINKGKMKEIHKHFNSRYVIIMNDKANTRITTGLTYYNSIRQHLGL